jgi:hypothetical protein
MNTPFTVVPELTTIAIAYRNAKMIANRVLPMISPVGTLSFRYRRYSIANGVTLPETRVGRLSRPNMAEHVPFEELEATVENHAIDLPLPKADLDEAAAAGYNLRGKAIEQCTDIIELRREYRAAKLVMDPNQYDANHKETLAAADRWDTTTGDPLSQIDGIRDGMFFAPNKAVMGKKGLRALQKNPNMVKAYHGNLGDKGKVPIQGLCEILELDEILVGEGWVNIAKPGQAPNLVRVWGDSSVLLFNQNGNADRQVGVTFGYTVPNGTRYGGEIMDPDMGGEGGVRVRTGEKVKEIVAAPDLAYLIQTVVG